MTTRELSSAGLTVMHTRIVPLLWVCAGTPALVFAASQAARPLAVLLVVAWVGVTLKLVNTARALWHVVLVDSGALHGVGGLPRRSCEVPLAAIRGVSEGRAPGGACAITLFLEPALTSGLVRLSFIPRRGTYRRRPNPTADELRALSARAGARTS